MSSYIVAVMSMDAMGQAVVNSRTVVYADSELEAKQSGASQLGVSMNAVTVSILGDTGMAPNSTIIGKQDG